MKRIRLFLIPLLVSLLTQTAFAANVEFIVPMAGEARQATNSNTSSLTDAFVPLGDEFTSNVGTNTSIANTSTFTTPAKLGDDVESVTPIPRLTIHNNNGTGGSYTYNNVTLIGYSTGSASSVKQGSSDFVPTQSNTVKYEAHTQAGYSSSNTGSISTLTQAIASAYQFWSTQSGSYQAANPVEIWIMWSENDAILLTFEANGGVFLNGTSTYTTETKTGKVTGGTMPDTPTKRGFTCKGWSRTLNGTVVNLSTETITAATTYYAVWSLSDWEYASTEVVLNPNGGDVVVNNEAQGTDTIYVIEMVKGQRIANIPYECRRDGYTFVGWTDELGSLTPLSASDYIYENENLYAVYTAGGGGETDDEYVITWDANGGVFAAYSNKKQLQSKTSNKKITALPKSPTYSGYMFKGWGNYSNSTVTVDPLEAELTGPTTYYAVWDKSSEDNYNVTFIAGDTTGGSKFSDKTYSKVVNVQNGKTVQQPEIPSDTKTLTFDHWSTVKVSSWVGYGTPYDFSSAVTKTLTLYAVYKYQDNSTRFKTVVFDYNGGTYKGKKSVSVDVALGTPVDKPETPKRDNYKFQGWFTSKAGDSASKWDFSYTIDQDTRLYAVWKEKKSSDAKTDSADDSDTKSDAPSTTNTNNVVPADANTSGGANLTQNADGQIVDANGNVIYNADGTSNVMNPSVPKTGVDSIPILAIGAFVLLLGIAAYLQIRKFKHSEENNEKQ